MLQLKKLQAEQQAKKAAEAAAASAANAAPANPAAPAAAGNGDGTLLMHRGNSKESLTEIRKQKSRDNVFSLRTKQSSGSDNKRANAAELRAQKGTESKSHIIIKYTTK